MIIKNVKATTTAIPSVTNISGAKLQRWGKNKYLSRDKNIPLMYQCMVICKYLLVELSL